MDGALHWVVAVAALIGVWLNIHKHISCFYVWVVTNSIWAYVDLRHGLPAQAALQSVYAVLSIYGIVSWSRSKRPTSQNVLRGGPGRSRS